jgi:hypothetical protein
MMLEGLSLVDWKGLQCAFGTGEQLPPLIRQLTSDDQEAALEALNEIGELINHQGSAYEASAPTIPFLIELLTVKSVQMKGGILYLLQGFTPSTYWIVENISSWFDPERSAAQAVLAGLPVYIELLNHPETYVRVSAFELLCRPSLYPADKIPQITAALNRCFESETEPDPKLTMTVLFGEYLAAYKQILSREQVHEFGQMFETLWRSETNKDISYAASVSLAQIMEEEAPDDIVEGLVEALANPKLNSRTGLAESIAPGIPSGIDLHAELALSHLGFQRNISAFASALQQVSDPGRARKLATALLSWVMAGIRMGFAVGQREEEETGRVVYKYPIGVYRQTVESLTAIERQALDAVLKADKVWEEPHNLLEMYGLPASREEARQLLDRHQNRP